MSKLTDRVSYLQGLAEGLKLDPAEKTNRLLLEMLDVLHELSSEVEALESDQEDLNGFVESIDEDLAELEERMPPHSPFGPRCGKGCCDFDDDEDDEEEDEDGPEVEITCVCPHCGAEINFGAEDFDLDEDSRCPMCGEVLFPDGMSAEVVEDEEDAEPDKDDND